MDVKIIQKTLKQQKDVSTFLADIQCREFWCLIIQKINKIYHGKDCMKKFCESLKEHAEI